MAGVVVTVINRVESAGMFTDPAKVNVTVGATPPVPVTVVDTAFEVTIVPDESVTRAVIRVVPAVAGVQLSVHVEPLSVPLPMDVPFEKNSTPETVSPVPTVVLAESVVTAPTVAPAGTVSETVGAAATVTLTAGDDVAVAKLLSVTLAVISDVPALVGRHVLVKVVLSVVVPTATTVVPTRNSTALTVAPTPGDAVAASATDAPTLTILPGPGAVSETVGPPPALTVTFTTGEMADAPVESVT